VTIKRIIAGVLVVPLAAGSAILIAGAGASAATLPNATATRTAGAAAAAAQNATTAAADTTRLASGDRICDTYAQVLRLDAQFNASTPSTSCEPAAEIAAVSVTG
jgi:hypothetical protein